MADPRHLHPESLCAQAASGDPLDVDALRSALAYSGPVAGLTHTFYNYPARFAPEAARAIIEAFSAPGDLVADCFMGGATSIVESLATGRRALGVDINALSHFLAEVKTTPLSTHDVASVTTWAADVRACAQTTSLRRWVDQPKIPNLPPAIARFLAAALTFAEELSLSTDAERFARAALLRVGQWALESRGAILPNKHALADQLLIVVNAMLSGLASFIAECEKNAPAAQWGALNVRRLLLNRDAVGLHSDPRVQSLHGSVQLALMSPPYPGVHVLYHRWQHRGRKETRAPYWVTGVPDGHGEAYYTLGGRSASGVEKYFLSLQAVFHSLRPLLRPDARVVQIVAFRDPVTDLRRFLHAMAAAGYEEDEIVPGRIWRTVPHRRWYQRVAEAPSNAGREVMLVHRIR